jgi:hypothetical protein
LKVLGEIEHLTSNGHEKIRGAEEGVGSISKPYQNFDFPHMLIKGSGPPLPSL